MIIGGWLAEKILERFKPFGETAESDAVYKSVKSRTSKVEKHFEPQIWETFAGKTIVDFGCGGGLTSLEIAEHGAGKVIGVDIRDERLELATRRAEDAGLSDRCVFMKAPLKEKADVVLTMDTFEHFDDPEDILKILHGIVKPTGYVLVSFGPPWLHPNGGHLFSVFPWAHLIFTEKSLIKWRGKYRSDGATRFGEVEGGLNQMTVGRFLKMIERSPFRVAELKLMMIKKLQFLANPLTREFFTSEVRCKLVPRP